MENEKQFFKKENDENLTKIMFENIEKSTSKKVVDKLEDCLDFLNCLGINKILLQRILGSVEISCMHNTKEIKDNLKDFETPTLEELEKKAEEKIEQFSSKFDVETKANNIHTLLVRGIPNQKPKDIITHGSYSFYLYDGEDVEQKWKTFIQLVGKSDKPKEFGKLSLHNMDLLLIMSRAANFYKYKWTFETATGIVYVDTREEHWYFMPFEEPNKRGIWHKNRGLNKGYHFQRKDSCSAEENIRFFHYHECETYRVKFLGDVANEPSCKGNYRAYRKNATGAKKRGYSRADKIMKRR